MLVSVLFATDAFGLRRRPLGVVSHLLYLSWTAQGFVVLLQLAQWTAWTYAVLLSRLLRGCSERSQQPDYVGASAFCRFWINPVYNNHTHGLDSAYAGALLALVQLSMLHFHISCTREVFFPRLTVGAFACKLQNDQPFSFFFFLIWNRWCCERHVVITVYEWIIFIFFNRALQFPPEGWLRMSLNNGSITHLVIRPNGRVALRTLGDTGFMPPDKITRTWISKTGGCPGAASSLFALVHSATVPLGFYLLCWGEMLS